MIDKMEQKSVVPPMMAKLMRGLLPNAFQSILADAMLSIAPSLSTLGGKLLAFIGLWPNIATSWNTQLGTGYTHPGFGTSIWPK